MFETKTQSTTKPHEIINKEEKEKLIMEHHVDKGHASAHTTYKLLKRYYVWLKMREDCIKVIRECEQCALFNEEKLQNLISSILVGDAFEKIGIDLIGPHTETKEGNKNIIVAIDNLTKYTIIHAKKLKTAHKIAKFLFNKLIIIHGCPDTILLDNGHEFKNAKYKSYAMKCK